MRPIRLCCLTGLLLACEALRQVTWTAKTRRSLPTDADFKSWFLQDDRVPACVIAASEVISDVTALGDDRYEAYLSSTTFPFVTLEPKMIFACSRNAEGAIVIQLLDQKMDASGPSWATNIVLATSHIMNTTSTCKYWIDDGDELVGEASVATQFDIPRWVPIPVTVIQNSGQGAIQKQVDDDVLAVLAKLATTPTTAP
mmetsp:Transcript_22973/g.72036  ORF Transcript_22973/g.72036 Transcript_22973/m.72036 type:complete len:199 (-) Transcript_22973:128-724(-)